MRFDFDTFIDKWIYKGDRNDPDSYRRGKFFLISIFIFFDLSFIGSALYCIEHHSSRDIAFVVISLVPILIPLYIYPRYGKRVLMVNLINFCGLFFSLPFTYKYTGGIFAADFTIAIVTCAWVFLCANKISGYVWTALTLIVILFLWYAAQSGWHDFRADEMKFGPEYNLLVYLFALLFLCFIIIYHEKGKEEYLVQIVDGKTQIERQHAELVQKKEELEVQKADIVSSIKYARRIQDAILPAEETINRSVPLSFVFYRPRDIVSGDFFWFHEIDRDAYIIACADCTGHGVPGAFMTVIGTNSLSQIVIDNKIYSPAKILASLDDHVTTALKQEKNHFGLVQDGMELSVLYVNKAKKEFSFSSARRTAFFIHDGSITDLRGSRSSIGGLRNEQKTFEDVKMNFSGDDVIYLFTDGIVDQFGGANNKKFTTKRFRALVHAVYELPVQAQKEKITEEFMLWKGDLGQTDDVLVIGIRF